MTLLHTTVVIVGRSGGQAVCEYLRTIGHRPEIVGKRQHARPQIGNGNVRCAVRAVGCDISGIREVARQKTLARWYIRIHRAIALPQPLLEAFVVSKHEQLVFHQRTSDGSSELMPFERTLLGLEEVSGIQSAVTVIL